MQQPGTPGFKSGSILGKSALEQVLLCLAAELARLDQSTLGLPPVQTGPLVVVNLDEVAHGQFCGMKCQQDRELLSSFQRELGDSRVMLFSLDAVGFFEQKFFFVGDKGKTSKAVSW